MTRETTQNERQEASVGIDSFTVDEIDESMQQQIKIDNNEMQSYENSMN